MGIVDSLAHQIQVTPEWNAAVERAEQLRKTIAAGSPKDARKFLRLDDWLDAIIKRIVLLGLHRAPRMTVLDLGTGTAMFPFVCAQCGHEPLGLDLRGEDMTSPGREIFMSLPAAFKVPVLRTAIRPCSPIKVTGKYDLITGFLVSFNNHKRHHEWGALEWQYFVNNVTSHLNEGGRLVLMLNSHAERFGDLEYYDRDTRDYFASVGNLYGASVIIPPAPSAPRSVLVEDPGAWDAQRSLEGHVLPALWQTDAESKG